MRLNARNLQASPRRIVGTARGDLPARHPALRACAVIATTTDSARRLGGRIPVASSVLVAGEGPALRGLPDPPRSAPPGTPACSSWAAPGCWGNLSATAC